MPQSHRQSPAPEHLLELTQIWNADKRTPSVLSRRAWALARNLRVEAVHRWWHRRRQVAKRVGETLLEETYELDVGTPPVFVEGVKAEEEEEEAEEARRGVARNTRGGRRRQRWRPGFGLAAFVRHAGIVTTGILEMRIYPSVNVTPNFKIDISAPTKLTA
ncbi:hypothetical protein Hypma_000031 [Hypsizygus marmoreus]|uniref:Homeobox domain-containing protein n=1 Tax=Hypsizygus marmoreus TaxID=39966 RepID=A0A369KBV4_HYPMA|nr:hypothetical protein Hypma_000031 [Hypsizygus marmoreus]